jgi:predicted nuclease of predicted toxin-antitoxin system
LRPEFFVDRSLGRHSVAAALRSAGWVVTTHHEDYGGRDEDVRDVEWLELCADRSLVVLSKDRRLRYRPDEIAVIRRRRLRVFVLSRGNLTSSAQVGRFVGNAARIEAEIARRGPFVCVVYAAGVVRVFP